jgi:hypothetical protein
MGTDSKTTGRVVFEVNLPNDWEWFNFLEGLFSLTPQHSHWSPGYNISNLSVDSSGIAWYKPVRRIPAVHVVQETTLAHGTSVRFFV